MRRELFISLVTLGLIHGLTLSVQAQSITAAPDGTGTVINTNGNQIDIQGGTQAGGNLFHSFQQFNLNTHQIANFIANPTIQNILSRVVGGSPSYIDGLIRVSGSAANLYLMNPAGIVFGANASLNVPASFTATTAHGIGFGCTNLACDGWFAASGPTQLANLSGPPGGFAFLTHQPGAIVNAGNLAVPAGQSLTLVGGTIINTGTLTAPSGQVNILAVPGDRYVRIQDSNSLLSLELPLDTQPPLTATAPPLSAPSLPQLLTGGNLSSATGVTVENGVVTLTQSATPIATTPGSLTLAGHISVDAATPTGNAGRAIALGKDTQFFGTISAQGGNLSGNGGFVETSGNQHLAIAPSANVNTSAPNGTMGTWLLDPATLTVVASGGTGTISSGTNSIADSTINASTVVSALNGTNITLQADNLITIDALIDASGNSNLGNLTLQAPTIILNQRILLTPGSSLDGTAQTVSVGANGSIQNGVDVAQTNANVYLTATTYFVTQPIELNKPITLQGAGAANTIINGSGVTRIFNVSGNNVTLDGLSLTNGNASRGGAIYNTGNLTIQNSALAQNMAGSGGAIYNLGNLALVNSNLTNNQAASNGGAIYTAFHTQIINSSFSNNQASGSGGAIDNAAWLQVSDSVFLANIANQFGGALYNEGFARLVDNTFIDNQTPTSRQAIYNVGQLVSSGDRFITTTPSLKNAPPVLTSPALTSLPAPPILASTAAVLSQQTTTLDQGSPLSARSITKEKMANGEAPILNAQSGTAASQMIAATDSSFSKAYEQHLGLPPTLPLNIRQLQNTLKQIKQRGIRSALIYVSFIPKQAASRAATATPSSPHAPQADDQLQLILLRAEGDPIVKQIPVSRAEVVQQAKLFRVTVSDPEDDQSYIPLAQQLYGWLVAPLAADLQADGITSLVFCLDEGLRTIPIAALMDQQTFLIERYAVSIMPSAALTNLAVTPPKIDKILAMGADRFTTKEALPAVPLELKTVSTQIAEQAVLLNDQFTLSNLLSTQNQDRPDILHMATHAQFQAGDTQQSYIQLWDNRLTLAQMRSLNWKAMNLTLLTLSACTTALSSREAELGFAGLAAVSGVRAAVGSLWTVSDVGTLALMDAFYSRMQSSTSLAEALQSAQKALLKGEIRLEGDRLTTRDRTIPLPPSLQDSVNIRFSHPFYWSSFLLIGNPW